MKEFNKKKFCENLKILRIKAGWSQKEAAQQLGRSTAEFWSRLERGGTESLTMDLIFMLGQICKDQGFSLEWLMLGEESGAPTSTTISPEWASNATHDELILEIGKATVRLEYLKELLNRSNNQEAKDEYVQAVFGPQKRP